MRENHSEGAGETPDAGRHPQPPSWSHDDVLEILEHSALFLQASVSGLKNERLDTEPVADGASVRDIIAHLAACEDEFLREATAAAKHNHVRFDYQIRPGGGVGACMLEPVPGDRRWDAQQRESRRGKPTGAIFLELEQAQHRLMQFVRGLSPRKLQHEADWPWGRHGTLAELLVTVAAHKRAHAEAIREWRTSGHF